MNVNAWKRQVRDLLMVPLPFTITFIGRCSVAYIIFASVCRVVNVSFFLSLFCLTSSKEMLRFMK